MVVALPGSGGRRLPASITAPPASLCLLGLPAYQTACAAPADACPCSVANSQDVVAGDGTTSVTVLCGALLKKSLELLEKGVSLCNCSLAACELRPRLQKLREQQSRRAEAVPA